MCKVDPNTHKLEHLGILDTRNGTVVCSIGDQCRVELTLQGVPAFPGSSRIFKCHHSTPHTYTQEGGCNDRGQFENCRMMHDVCRKVE